MTGLLSDAIRSYSRLRETLLDDERDPRARWSISN